MSFAGSAAAGGGLSGMFWNPAVAAFAPAGIYTESHYAAIFGYADMTAGPGTTPPLLGLNNQSGDIARDAVVPSSYVSYRLTDRMVFALSVNSPFGLVTEAPNRIWSGQTFARTSEIKTYNFAPTLAYRLSPFISFGVGLQIEHIEGRLKHAAGIGAASSTQNLVVQGDDTAFGFTAGVNITPTSTTQIGLGYRSAIDHTLEGTVSAPGANALVFGPGAPFAAAGAAIKAGTTLPEIATLSFRQAIGDRFALLGSAEWTHWSRLDKLDVTCANNQGGNPVFCPLGNGQLVSSIPFNWHDSWFFSLGGEYKYSHHLTLRSGVGYELSPVQNPTERVLAVPDRDRLWTSLGGTYKWSENVAFDLGYTHIFGMGDDKIDRLENGVHFVGKVDNHVDIVSASVKIKFGGEEPVPLK